MQDSKKESGETLLPSDPRFRWEPASPRRKSFPKTGALDIAPFPKLPRRIRVRSASEKIFRPLPKTPKIPAFGKPLPLSKPKKTTPTSVELQQPTTSPKDKKSVSPPPAPRVKPPTPPGKTETPIPPKATPLPASKSPEPRPAPKPETKPTPAPEPAPASKTPLENPIVNGAEEKLPGSPPEEVDGIGRTHFTPPRREEESKPISKEAEEILQEEPPWLNARRMSALVAFITVLVILSWLIKIPEVVSSPVTISGANPIVTISAPSGGTLAKFAVADQQRVDTDDVLAVFESSVEPDRVLRLKSETEKLLPLLEDPSAFADLNLPPDSRLGDLTPSYTQFRDAYLRYQATLETKTVTAPPSNLKSAEDRVAAVKKQSADAARQAVIAAQQFERATILHQRQTMAATVFQRFEKARSAAQTESARLATDLKKEESALTEKRNELRATQLEADKTLADGRTALRNSFAGLLSDIDAWETDHVVRAPVRGVASLSKIEPGQRQFAEGAHLLILIPEEEPLLGRISLAYASALRIHNGQTVRMLGDGYSEQKHGVIIGSVAAVTASDDNVHRIVTVKLDSPLVTNTGNTIEFSQELQGEADILIGEKRLIELAIEKLRRALESHSG